jgi:hypothetical protein
MTMRLNVVSDSNLRVEARNGGGVYEGRSQINLVAGFAINVHLRRIYHVCSCPK